MNDSRAAVRVQLSDLLPELKMSWGNIAGDGIWRS
jgi:hypothetical protein